MPSNGPPFEKFIPQYVDFEWDEAKRKKNLEKHRIDFIRVLAAFDGPMVRRLSPTNNEARYLAIGLLDDKEISIAFQERGNSCRIISVRRARRVERAAYRALYA